MSQKEGDTLRGDLLANQKALSDLNVYADSLRSRYAHLYPRCRNTGILLRLSKHLGLVS